MYINPDVAAKHLTYTADTLSALAIVTTLLGWLPPLAAFAGFVWYVIQIWESKTVQKKVRAWKMHRAKKRKHKH